MENVGSFGEGGGQAEDGAERGGKRDKERGEKCEVSLFFFFFLSDQSLNFCPSHGG